MKIAVVTLGAASDRHSDKFSSISIVERRRMEKSQNFSKIRLSVFGNKSDYRFDHC
jgi:hypothetical protein